MLNDNYYHIYVSIIIYHQYILHRGDTLSFLRRRFSGAAQTRDATPRPPRGGRLWRLWLRWLRWLRWLWLRRAHGAYGDARGRWIGDVVEEFMQKTNGYPLVNWKITFFYG